MNILLVDDTPYAREPIRLQLLRAGHEVQTADDGVQALAIFEAAPFDLVITDVRMPHMDGLELLKRIKALRPDQDIIMVTGYAELDSSVQALRLGASNYLLKPINMEELLISVERLAKRQEQDRRYKDHEERLIKARKMAEIGQVAAGVAHEINNPNTFVRGNAQILMKYWPIIDQYVRMASEGGLTPPDKLPAILTDVPHLLQAILDGTSRIKKIVDGMTVFTSADRDVGLQPVDVNMCIRKALTVCAESLEGICVRENLAPDLPPVKGQPEELTGLIVELLKNSITALRDRQEPVIEVATLQDSPSGIQLIVEDNGVGVKAQDQNKVFTPFYTSHAQIGRPGLGLSKVYTTVRRFEGDVSLTSTEGRGTRVAMRLAPFKERSEK